MISLAKLSPFDVVCGVALGLSGAAFYLEFRGRAPPTSTSVEISLVGCYCHVTRENNVDEIVCSGDKSGDGGMSGWNEKAEPRTRDIEDIWPPADSSNDTCTMKFWTRK